MSSAGVGGAGGWSAALCFRTFWVFHFSQGSAAIRAWSAGSSVSSRGFYAAAVEYQVHERLLVRSEG